MFTRAKVLGTTLTPFHIIRELDEYCGGRTCVALNDESLIKGIANTCPLFSNGSGIDRPDVFLIRTMKSPVLVSMFLSF